MLVQGSKAREMFGMSLRKDLAKQEPLCYLSEHIDGSDYNEVKSKGGRA